MVKLSFRWCLAVFFIIAVAVFLSIFLYQKQFSGTTTKTEGMISPESRPNIIMILVDALRANRLGCYGHDRNTSPTVDNIASDGIIFEHVISQAPWTQPAVASLFSSRYPSVHKVINISLVEKMEKGKVPKMAVFNKAFTTFVESLDAVGYDTAGFTANPFMSESYGFERGFDHYADMSAREGKEQRGNQLNDEVVEWLKKRDSQNPFFIYIHYMDVHGPYYARDEYIEPFMRQVRQIENKQRLSKGEVSRLGYLLKRSAAPIVEKHGDLTGYREFWSAFYDAGVREQDHHIANLKKRIEDIGLWNDAYVIFTSDHGEELFEKGFCDHGNSLYDTELHVPLILRWDGVLAKGKRIDRTVSLVDFMPTVIEQLKLDDVEGLQGTSFMDDIITNSSQPEVMVFSEAVKYRPNIYSVHLDDWKLIMNFHRKTIELYNISKDPSEMVELSKQYPDKKKELVAIIQSQIETNAKLSEKIKRENIPINQEQYERLKSLGYVK